LVIILLFLRHIPKNLVDDEPVKRNEGEYQIPGYQGYIPSIKSENMYGKTYGKLTYTISSQKYHKGQDVEPQDRYSSSYAEIFVNQRDVQQRTAAEMVGVVPKNEKYKKVNRRRQILAYNSSLFFLNFFYSSLIFYIACPN
jgi:hypothetical protein